MALSNLHQVFEDFLQLNVLVLGDVMLDRYLYGSVTRISPEAPVPIVEWASEENRLGGAANVALNLKALGATPFLLGVVGQDQDGEHFFDLMPQVDLQNQWLLSNPGRRTTVKTRVMAGNQQLLRLDKEQTDPLPKLSELKLLQKLLELLERHPIHIIIFQDYDKGTLTPFIIEETLREAKKRGVPVAVDPKFKNFWRYKGVDLFKPNLKEVKDALKITVTPHEASLRSASRMIREKLGNKITFITLSEHGSYIDDDASGTLLPTQPRNVADVCGAGDTVISIAALALALGLSKTEIALLANLAGGQVVEKSGVVCVDPIQLKNELVQLQLAG